MPRYDQKLPDARRDSPRIAIRPSAVATVDEIIQLRGKGESRADIVELAIQKLKESNSTPVE